MNYGVPYKGGKNKIAEKIISEVIEAVKGWRELATRLSISKREADMFAGVLDGRYKAE